MSETAPTATAVMPRSWPFDEARKLVERMAKSGKSTALFETGYGPSGLPHIGTFGEVARTTMGAPRLHRADRRPHPAARLLR